MPLSIKTVGCGAPDSDPEALVVRRLNQYSSLLVQERNTCLLTDPAKLLAADAAELSPDTVVISHESMDHLDTATLARWAERRPFRLYASAGSYVTIKRASVARIDLHLVIPGTTVNALGWTLSFGRSVHGHYLEPILARIITPTGVAVLHAFDSEPYPLQAGSVDVGIFPAGIAPGFSAKTFAQWEGAIRPRFALSNHHLESSTADIASVEAAAATVVPLQWNGWVSFRVETSGAAPAARMLELPDRSVPREQLAQLEALCGGGGWEPLSDADDPRARRAASACRALALLGGTAPLSELLPAYEQGLHSGDDGLVYASIEMFGLAGTRDELTASEALERLCAGMRKYAADKEMPVRRKMALEILRLARAFPALAPLTRDVMLWGCSDFNPDVRGLAATALAMLPDLADNAKAQAALLRLVGDVDPDVRCAAMDACGPLLTSPEVRAAVVRVAEANRNEPPPLCDACVRALDSTREAAV